MGVIIPKPIIAIYSLAPRSGKTTLACRITKEWGYERVSFAEPLRRMVLDFITSFGVDYVRALKYLYEEKEVEIPQIGASARKLMQTLGTEWGRVLIGRDIWVRAMEKKVLQIPVTRTRGIVIDDMRFLNEAQWVTDMGGMVVRIDRDAAVESYDGDHPSEGELAGFRPDLILKNNSGLEALWDEFVRAIKSSRAA